jgi:flagellar biosynthesis GTPase FlhF
MNGNLSIFKLLQSLLFSNFLRTHIDDPEGGGGGNVDDPDAPSAEELEATRLEQEAAAAKTAADEAKARAAAAKSGVKPTDGEAKLLKEQMKTKDALKAAQAALEQANARLADYDGLDAATAKKLKADAAEKERKEAEARGEYDRILKQMADQHQAEKDRLQKERDDESSEKAALRQQIADLTVGTSFTGSEFLKKETNLTPTKARVIYGAHFEFKDGHVVGYDKPAGAADRTPLVDSAGNPRSFEDAMKAIIEADPDRDAILLSKVKPGAGSGSQGRPPKEIVQDPSTMSSIQKISAGLAKLKQSKP